MGGEVVGRVKLMKLLFLADYLSVKERGAPLSGYDWMYHVLGPYSRKAIKDIHELVRDGKLAEGYDYKSDNFIYVLLDRDFTAGPDTTAIARRVVSKYGSMETRDLVKECYRILTDLGAKPGEPIRLLPGGPRR